MRVLVLSILAFASQSALANGTSVPEIPKPQYFSLEQNFSLNPVSQAGAKANASANSVSNSSSSSVSTSSSTSSANSDNNNSITNDGGSSRTYVAPAPSYATPLPGNLCPLGNSLAWSIGWNFFSYSSSSTRTELECLERVLASLRPSVPEVKVVEVTKEVVVKVPEVVYVEKPVEKIVYKNRVVYKNKPIEECPAGAKKATICEAVKK